MKALSAPLFGPLYMTDVGVQVILAVIEAVTPPNG
jgi:hypothetical protein